MDLYPQREKRELPPPPHWKQALGVGIVVMGLAIGTGELIMWPHLTVKFGFEVLWLALFGIGAQYFINQEVARNALATGEGFFLASSRILKWFAPFWLVAALLLYVWPGWASAIGTLLAELFGLGSYLAWSWAALVLVLILTFSGKFAYAMLEHSLKITVPAFFILLVSISFFNLSLADIVSGLRGLVNFGSIPKGIDTNVLLSAIVFSGAGGMLNLCISLWYRDKQAGMGAYVERIANPVTGKAQAVAVPGFYFEPTNENIARWKGWMRYMRIDQGVIFFFLGFVTLFLLSVNARSVLAPRGIVPEGLSMATTQAHIFGEQWGVFGFKLFLAMASLMLFSVLWTIIDALARIVSDIVYVNAQSGPFSRSLVFMKHLSLHRLYYAVVLGVVAIGAILLPFKQPFTLLTISAVLGGVTMAIYTPLLTYMNRMRLPRELQPGNTTVAILIAISIFFTYFAVRVILQYL